MLVDATDPLLVDLDVAPERLETAAMAAAREIREAIEHRYVAPPDLDSFPPTNEGQELRALVEQHGVAIAAHFASSKSGGHAKRFESDAVNARRWLASIKAGKVNLSPPLALKSTTAAPAARQLLVCEPTRTRLSPDLWKRVF